MSDCAQRSHTAYGSSLFNTTAYSARDLLQSNCTANPSFCDWSMVYAQYVDGTSRSGDVAAPVRVGRDTIFFRGHRVLEATLDALLAPGGPGAGMPSLALAPEVLITGSSAGGLTTFLHADAVSARVHAVNPSASVRAVPEVGFFLDGASIWGGARIMTDVFAFVANFSNVTGGAAAQVNAECVASTPAAERYKCFMAQYTLPHMETPTFVVNSMHDEWQAGSILAPNVIANWSSFFAVTTYAPFKACIANPTAGCNATQAEQWMDYGGQFLTALAAARAATPPARAARGGGVITSCPIHTTLIGGLSHRIRVRGVSLYDAIVNWYVGGGSAGGMWTFDVDFPLNPTCPHASDVRAIMRGVDGQ